MPSRRHFLGLHDHSRGFPLGSLSRDQYDGRQAPYAKLPHILGGWAVDDSPCLRYFQQPDATCHRRYEAFRKRPWRYRWPDDFRDEVLARLLELNRQRAEEERLSGLAAEPSTSPKRKRVNSKTKTKTKKHNPDPPDAQPSLFDE